MPAARWWEFENGTVDLGRLKAAPDDLGRLLLAEFALIYGNDFFVVPLTLPSGSICRVTELEVQTTYGETVRVDAAPASSGVGTSRWQMFQLNNGKPDDPGPGLLVLPPCAVDVLDGPVAEEVLLTRDETANLAWGIELRVTGPLGLPVERREVQAAADRRGAPPGKADSTLRYRLSTRVPDSWLPLTATTGGMSFELTGTTAPAGTLTDRCYAVSARRRRATTRWPTRHPAHACRPRPGRSHVRVDRSGMRGRVAGRAAAAFVTTT